MTARDHARIGARRPTERGRRTPVSAVPPPRLGEILYAARERKGVDLYRAERDTKIRARFLAALERSDFRDLPGAVYTKGFLRNYALYLGLDPDAVLAQWKNELGPARQVERQIMAPPPQPIATPRGGLKFTPGIIVAALLTVGVFIFAGYIGYQLFRFAQPPTLSVDQPQVSESTAETFALAGSSVPDATITIQAPGQQVHRVSADKAGHWQQVVNLNKGRNDFTISATDPASAKVSLPVTITVNVPMPVGPGAPTLALSSPNDGTSFTNGAIPVQGTTNAKGITVSGSYVGPLQATSGRATPVAPPMPASKQITVRPDGTFSDAYQLAPGRWTLTIAATSDQQKTTTETRHVSVAFTGVNLVVDIRNNPAWIKVWIDGQPATGYDAGKTLPPGESVEFTARRSVEVRTGSSGSTFFSLNGNSLGSLGPPGTPETWLFEPPASPRKTDRK
jgi:cytoskeletal protein RodZ